MAKQLSTRSCIAWERKICAADGGPPFAERAPPTAEHFERVRERLVELGQRYEGCKFVLGNQLTYVDLVVVASLVMLTLVIPEERKDQTLAVDDGRWRKLLDEFEAAGYLATDSGEVYVPKT
jgi:hypothetical protein